MAELKEREAEASVEPDGAKMPSQAAVKKRQRAKRRRIRRIIITLVIVLAIIAGILYGMYRLFREEEIVQDIMTAQIYRGSIQSMVSGSGQAMPRDSATITLSAGGTVLEVFVKDGDQVQLGDPLYVIDSTAAQQAVEDAQKTVNNLQKQLDAVMKTYGDLTVRADFKGTLINTAKIKPGDSVSVSTPVATLVDDTKMRLALEFSYAYQDAIYVGQAATVSLPMMMNELTGVVTEVNYIRRVTMEGTLLFQAVLEVENPGSLTEGMGASAWLVGGDGEEIYPYDGGKLEYSRSVNITTKASGTALTVNLLDYMQVSAGQTLLVLGEDSNDETVATLENQLRTAQDSLERAQKNLENFNASAPMSGTVLSCTLVAGEAVDSGRVAITIADTTKMIIEARIDEMNVAYVKPGMVCSITQYSRNDVLSFMGVVESVSLEGKYENGMSYFPAVITVDNYDGSLMSGMYTDYSLTASQSDDCLLAPVQSVKYTSEGICVFVKADAPPENALDTEALGIEVPEGFYAVPVTIGISDTYNVEIIEGVAEMDEVFTQYGTPQGGMYGGMGGISVRVG